MKIHFYERAVALGLATLINLALLGSIEYLAGKPQAPGLWAAAVTADRG